MANNFKKTLAILQHEFRLQVITFSLVLGIFMLSLFVTKLFYPVENDLARMFIGFYTIMIGLVLPWQMNTKGDIELGYCRYHLSLPVATWQLYMLPLAFRLLLIFTFVGVELLLHKILYHGASARIYVTTANMLISVKISLLIYLALQAYGWSKDSFKQLFMLFGAIFIAIAFIKISIIPYTIENPYFTILVLLFIGLAIMGLKKMRLGISYGLPDWRILLALPGAKKCQEPKKFKNCSAAHFHHEWRRSWFYMPLLTIVLIVFCLLIKFRSNSMQYNFLAMAIFYVAMILIVPLCGIILLKSRGFSSSFINQLPIATKHLTAVRFKCFSLSFALSLLILFTAGLIIIGYDNGLFRDLCAANSELMQSPLLLIWFFAAVLIYSFCSAFFIAGVYLNNRLVSIIMPLGMLGYYVYQLYGIFITRDFGLMPNGLPWYMPGLMMVCAMIAIKWGLLFLHKKNLPVKLLYSILVLVVSFFWVILANQQPFLMLLPLLLIFSFPLMAYQQSRLQIRHEIGYGKISVPWKLLVMVTVIFALFAGYTKFINQRFRQKLSQILENCRATNQLPAVVNKKVDASLLMATQMPDKTKVTRELKAYYLKKYHKKIIMTNILTDTKQYYRVRIFFRNLVDNKIAQKKYAKALKYYLFYSKLKLANSRNIYYSDLTYRLNVILKYYSPTGVELAELGQLSGRIIAKQIKIIKRDINNDLRMWGTGNTPIVIYKYGTGVRYQPPTFLGLKLADFSEFAFTPIDISRKINYAFDTFKEIKALGFMTDKTTDGILSATIYPNDTNYRGYLLNSIGRMQDIRLYVAILQYRQKYGTSPKNIKQLVPEFLQSHELYALSGYNNYYSLKRVGEHNQPKPLLRLLSLKSIEQYLPGTGGGIFGQQ